MCNASIFLGARVSILLLYVQLFVRLQVCNETISHTYLYYHCMQSAICGDFLRTYSAEVKSLQTSSQTALQHHHNIGECNEDLILLEKVHRFELLKSIFRRWSFLTYTLSSLLFVINTNTPLTLEHIIVSTINMYFPGLINTKSRNAPTAARETVSSRFNAHVAKRASRSFSFPSGG